MMSKEVEQWRDWEENTRGYHKWRTIFSIIIGFGWIIFLVVWLFFYASEYTIYQNLGVLLASIIALFIVSGSLLKSIDKSNIWKSLVSSISGLMFGVFLVIWLFYYASDYTLLRNIGVFFLALLIIAAINSLIWIPKTSSIGWRATVSAVSGLGWVIFLVYWLIVGSSTYNIYQNLAIFILSVLVLAGVNLVIWLSWGIGRLRRL